VRDSNQDVDELMKSTFISVKSEDIVNNSLQIKKKQVSKQERALLQKLRKL
jgi:hypothetical protein